MIQKGSDITFHPEAGTGISASLFDLELERRFFPIFKNASVGFAKVGLDCRWLYVNQTLCRMTGYSEAELLGMTFREVTHPEDLEADLANMRRVMAGEMEINLLEKRYIRKDGSIFWIHLTAALVRDDVNRPAYFVTIIEDIDQRKQAQKVLTENEERLRLVLQGSHDGFWDWDITTDRVYWSDRFYEIIGLDREMAPESADLGWRLMHPEDRPMVREAVERHLSDRTRYELQFRVLHSPSGEYRHVLSRAQAVWGPDGKPLRMAGVYTDITDRVRAELRLQESEARFRSLAEQAPVMIWMTDEHGGNIYSNQALLEFFGQTQTENLGDGWSRPIHPEDRELAYGAFMNAFEQRVSYTACFRVKQASDGSYRWISAAGSPRLTPDGSFEGYIGICADVTDMLEAREAAEAANHRKSRFLATMSHELRTPLNSIIGFSEMLAQELPGPLNEKQAVFARNIAVSGQHLLQIINEILDLAKIEAGKLVLDYQTVELDPLVRELRNMLSEIAGKKHVQLLFEIEAGLASVTVDPTRLKQILVNLLGNAVKFNREHGSVITRFYKNGGGRELICEVEDTGIGIPSDSIPELFQAFQQVDGSFARKHEGVGLGLAITRELVELHGGNITLSSREGEGSRFTVTLPLRRPETEPETKPETK